MKSCDKKWSTGDGNRNPLKYSFLENPMNSMKMHRDVTLEDELPMSSPERMKWLGQSGNSAQLWMCPVVKVKFNAVKKNIT